MQRLPRSFAFVLIALLFMVSGVKARGEIVLFEVYAFLPSMSPDSFVRIYGQIRLEKDNHFLHYKEGKRHATNLADLVLVSKDLERFVERTAYEADFRISSIGIVYPGMSHVTKKIILIKCLSTLIKLGINGKLQSDIYKPVISSLKIWVSLFPEYYY